MSENDDDEKQLVRQFFLVPIGVIKLREVPHDRQVSEIARQAFHITLAVIIVFIVFFKLFPGGAYSVEETSYFDQTQPLETVFSQQ
jgi:hypothetical protein